MKRVYFVRHGQSTSNVDEIVQGLDDPLTPEGERQALRLAERIKNLTVGALISSDALRAKETAKAISEAVDMPVAYSELFREIRRPASLVGMSRNDPEYQAFLKLEEEHFGEEGWRFEDGENYEDICARGEAALTYLETHESDDIVVVSHGYFLRFLVTMILLEKEMMLPVWQHTRKVMHEENTGITLCVLDSDRMWHLLTWNDHAHFAEG